MISVIGAGPTGCYTAYLLAKTGKDVHVFEEHSKIGEPVQCTGLVTSSINELLKLKKDIIVNEIDKVKIFSKNDALELKLKNKNIILDRKKFDNYLSDLAVSKGAKIFLNYKFIDNKNKLIKIRFNNKQETILKTEHLIGADGPLSQVAKSNNLFGKRRFMTGVQAIVKLKNENYIEFYPSIGRLSSHKPIAGGKTNLEESSSHQGKTDLEEKRKLFDKMLGESEHFDTFAWVVPENQDICRVGVASYKNPKDSFNKFLKSKNIKDKSIIEKQGGLIPIYNPRLKTKKDNVYLVGDAACQVKATTGGGIIQGLKAAECLADSITNKKDYEKEWKKKIGRDLLLHLKMRSIMDKFKDKDWDFLIQLFKKDNTKKIIENLDRDYPTKFMLKLVLNEPRLLYFLRFLF